MGIAAARRALPWFHVPHLPDLTFVDLSLADLSLADLSSGSRVGSGGVRRNDSAKCRSVQDQANPANINPAKIKANVAPIDRH